MTAGRPKGSFKWVIDGKPCTAQEFYKHQRALRRLSQNEEVQTDNIMLEKLIELRNITEALIKTQLSLK